ncbi:uncharacterized protein LOC133890071 isoform X2 [Phragmites australis]|uniref:uncharacterized protein LOC133890071 isoform X2 n=1 Tax=Phragmites australis TaxID=29695 RepID=UPI002D790E46|nr:uncharacterized protein LOC133890071 isoform X2 [Phragmites australis]
MKKVQKHAQIQDANILELKQKTKTLEERQLEQRCIDDPLHATQDAIYVDGPNSKRKRVYGDPQSQQFSMVEQQNNMMRRQNDDEYEDLQPPNKYCTTDKNEWETIQNDNAQQPKKHSSAYKRKEANACDYNVLQAYRASTEAYNTKNKHFKDDVRIDKNKHTNAAKVADLETSSYCSNHESSQYQRPYSDPQSQDFSLVEQQNNTMRRQNDDEYEDLQPPNKYSTRDKNEWGMIQNDNAQQPKQYSSAYKVNFLIHINTIRT